MITRSCAALALLMLLGCTTPSGLSPAANVAITPSGVKVLPSVGTRIGNVGIRVSP